MHTPRFIQSPGDAEAEQIIALYRAQGWWYPEDDGAAGHVQRLAAIIRGSHCFAVVEKDGCIIGMGRAVSDRCSDAYVQDVAVRSDLRGQGVGAAIVAALVDRLKADGLGWIGLIAERGSEPFYTRLGFAPMAGAVPMLLSS